MQRLEFGGEAVCVSPLQGTQNQNDQPLLPPAKTQPSVTPPTWAGGGLQVNLYTATLLNTQHKDS